jgi:hypothetical protein
MLAHLKASDWLKTASTTALYHEEAFRFSKNVNYSGYRVRQSLEEEELRMSQRNLFLQSSGWKSHLTKVEQTGQ